MILKFFMPYRLLFCSLLLGFIALRGAYGQIVLMNSTYFDNQVSTNCTNALQASVNCTDKFQNLAVNGFYGALNTSYLDSVVCASGCRSSLVSWQAAVSKACASDPQPFNGYPAIYAGGLLATYQNSSCLKDSKTGQYCMSYVSNQTAYLNATSVSSIPTSVLCSSCVLQLFSFSEGSAFGSYSNATASQYKSALSICSTSAATALPSPIATPGPRQPLNATLTTSNSTAPCLSGQNYTVKSGDTLLGIASANSVSSGTLAVLNGIYPSGTNLAAGASLCLPFTCKTYTVKANDTCWSIASSYNITGTQLFAQNPTLDEFCDYLTIGAVLCVSQPLAVYTPTTIANATVTQTYQYATSTVPPPGQTPFGTTSKCGKYYDVMSGDTCQGISLNQTINLGLFEQINPAINTNCSNLQPNFYYCVFPTADWNTTSNSTTTTTQAAPAPTTSGTTNNCYTWYVVKSGDTCFNIEQSYGITMAQFQRWNPSVDNNCDNLVPNDAYCVSSPT